jgi:5-methylcytosine-specific restriction enzyme subunit McrC
VNTIVIREGEELRLPHDASRAGLIRRLLRLSDSSPFPIFYLSRGILRAASVVGTVTCGAVRIELRAKTDSNDGLRNSGFLLNLLRYAGFLNTYSAAAGRVAGSRSDPVEVLIAEIADDMASGLRGGVPRRYELKDSEAPTVRGRIDFTRLSTTLPSDRTLIPIRYAPLTPINQLSRFIKWVAHSLLGLTHSVANRERLFAITSILRDVDMSGWSRGEIERLTLSKFEMHWQRTLSVARLMLLNQSLDPTAAGSSDGVAVVFPLDRLFERSLRRLLPTGDFTISHRTEDLYMLKSQERGNPAVRIRPDFVYRRGSRPIAVADAKWKVLIQGAPAFGVDPADLYQVNAYLTRYRLTNALMFFPKGAWMNEGWSHSYDIPGTAFHIHFVSVDIESLVSSERTVRLRALEVLGDTTTRLIPRRVPRRDERITIS